MKYLIASMIITSIVSTMMVTEVIAPEPLQSEIRVVYAEAIPEVALEVEKPLEVIVEPQREVYTVTAYCSCSICCGKWAKDRGEVVIGAWGKELIEDYSIASPLPFGTKVNIEGLGTYEVMDRTATWIADKYNGKVIDIYFGSDEEAHERALKFGRQQLEVTILD